MGFDARFVVDILKFPWPLFTKYKNVYSQGVRIEIPPLKQTLEYDIVLEKYGDINQIVFSQSGYKDLDKVELKLNNTTILSLFTKEVPQIKKYRPTIQFNSGDTLKLYVYNETGTSKSLKLDFTISFSD